MLNYIRPILLIFFLTAGFKAHAHQAESMDLHYNPQERRLYVEVYHKTGDRFVHYIEKVLVQVNDDIPQKYYARSQENARLAKNDYRLFAKEGDVLQVHALCSKGGTLSAFLALVPKQYNREDASYHADSRAKDDSAARRTLENYRYRRFHSHHGRRQHKNTTSTPPVLEPDPLRDAFLSQEALEQKAHRQSHETLFGPLKQP